MSATLLVSPSLMTAIGGQSYGSPQHRILPPLRTGAKKASAAVEAGLGMAWRGEQKFT